ncbi:hypothetical protein RB195_020346 [Necator americanus]|uniref:Uncharacterized protein n=1 Tax=Necator americanus TaxID=51031 RepID=A0ABR1CL61_NECAM
MRDLLTVMMEPVARQFTSDAPIRFTTVRTRRGFGGMRDTVGTGSVSNHQPYSRRGSLTDCANTVMINDDGFSTSRNVRLKPDIRLLLVHASPVFTDQ